MLNLLFRHFYRSLIDFRNSQDNVLMIISSSHSSSAEYNGLEVEEVSSTLEVDAAQRDLINDNGTDADDHVENVEYDVHDTNVQYEEDIAENVQYGGELVVELMSDLTEQHEQEQETISETTHGDLVTVNGDFATVTEEGEIVLLEHGKGNAFEVEPTQMTIRIAEDGTILEGDVNEQVRLHFKQVRNLIFTYLSNYLMCSSLLCYYCSYRKTLYCIILSCSLERNNELTPFLKHNKLQLDKWNQQMRNTNFNLH